MAIALIALFAGLQLVWDGTRTLWTNHAARPEKSVSSEALKAASEN